MLLSIGYDNFLWSPSILGVFKPDSAPMKKLRRDASEKGLLIDATSGRRTRSMILMNTGHVVLSALQPETLKARLYEQLKAQRIEEQKPSGSP
jgi:regulator of extracellular matrix RemA (YlzA/DUF370 family)